MRSVKAEGDTSGRRKGSRTHLTARLGQGSTRPVLKHDDSGSMLLALFAIIIVTSLVSVVLMATISQQAKTRRATDFTFAGQAADTAVNDALLMANTNVRHDTSAAADWWRTPRHGVTGDFMWSWSATEGDGNATLEVTAKGCRAVAATGCPASSSQTRTIHATLTAAVVKVNDLPTGEVAFILDPERSFGRALFADQDLLLQGAVTVGSYGNPPGTSFGDVGTNGLAGFGSGVTAAGIDGIYISNTQTSPKANRCSHAAIPELDVCNPELRKVHDIRPRLDISDTDFIDRIIASPDCPKPLKDWVASDVDSPRLRAHKTHCYSSMTFDENTSVNASGTASVYVDGPITVAPGVEVNNAPSSSPDTSALKIYSKGAVVSLNGGSSADPTVVAWALWAPNAACATNLPTGVVIAYGSMVCQKISTRGTFSAQWDYRLRSTPSELAGLRVWEITGYRE